MKMELKSQDKYWFPTRSYGWGWGLANSWHGWLVLAAYMASLGLMFHFLPPAENETLFAIGVALSTAILVAVCWLKGAPPRWRWGGE